MYSVDRPPAIWETVELAVGAEATRLRCLSLVARDPRDSVLLGQTRMDLDRARWEASVTNWDGYGALPVSQSAYQRALFFLQALPISSPHPEVAIDPDGEVSFRWHRAPSWVFSVSISGAGRLSFAGLFGRNSIYGTEFFVESIPQTVQDNLARLFPTGVEYTSIDRAG